MYIIHLLIEINNFKTNRTEFTVSFRLSTLLIQSLRHYDSHSQDSWHSDSLLTILTSIMKMCRNKKINEAIVKLSHSMNYVVNFNNHAKLTKVRVIYSTISDVF